MPASRVATMEDEPAAQVDQAREQKRKIEPGIEWPGAEESVERRAHRSARGRRRPGGWPEGRRLTRNSTRAVISAGFNCLP